MNFKIALCLHGYYGNRADTSAGDKARDYLYKEFLSKLDVDIFVHSWEPAKEGHITRQYKLKKAIFEPQKDFLIDMKKRGISNDWFDGDFKRGQTIYKNCKIQNTLSFLYSRKRSLELVEEGIYDTVISCRFDIGFRGGPAVRYLNFVPNLDMQYIYSAMWNQLNAGYADMWFFSDYKNMKLLATAYDRCYEYFLPNSMYELAVTTGWPDSQMMGNSNPKDPNQFSNEVLKPGEQRVKNLMRYPKWQCINNHILYKWFFIDSGLYKKSRFV